MPRFFRRFAEGVFDEADLRARVVELATFVGRAAAQYGLDPARIVALGYSNGANIAAATLLLRPEILAGAVLLRPMVPLEPATPPDLRHARVLLLSGASDPICPPEQAARLATLLSVGGAAVEAHAVAAGHGLVAADIDIARAWFAAGPAEQGA